MDYYDKKYGYKMISEIFVTNQYGALIAQTNRASDYYQADEYWWQQAKKDGLFVDDMALDESSGVYGISICLRVNDVQGQFVGVIKIVLNADEFGRILETVRNSSILKEGKVAKNKVFYPHCDLLTKDGRIIYSTEKCVTLSEYPGWKSFVKNLASVKDSLI